MSDDFQKVGSALPQRHGLASNALESEGSAMGLSC